MGVFATLVVGIALNALWPQWALLAIALLPIAAFATVYSHTRDTERRTVTVSYELNDRAVDLWKLIGLEFAQFALCGAIWEVSSGSSTRDLRRSAGAALSLARARAYFFAAMPPRVASNHGAWKLTTPRQTLYFLPDRILLYWDKDVHSFSYSEITADAGQGRFIEKDAVANDAQIVDHTWTYVNKDGSPDRRFRDNRQLPVCIYGQLRIRSARGLEVVLQTSNPELPKRMKHALELASAMRPTAPSEQSSLTASAHR